MQRITSYCGRHWPAACITFMQITHQIQALTEPLCRAQCVFIRCRTTSAACTTFMQITHQMQVLTEPLCRAQGVCFIKCGTK